MKTHSFGLHLPFVRTIEQDLQRVSIAWHTPSQTTYYPLKNAANEISKKINASNPTIMLLHGFQDGPLRFTPLANLYLNMSDYNMLLLDCELVLRGNYFHSVAMLQPISESISKFFTKLVQKNNLDPRTVHLIGMSLGAQLAGRIGDNIFKTSNKKIGRITGLDPAGPCFSGTNLDNVLDKKDAGFVDIIHVNKGIQGMVETLGHVDFMINGGGPGQPGCSQSVCSHTRGLNLYEESFKIPDNLIGRKCSSWKTFLTGYCDNSSISILGYNTSLERRGVHYLRTSSSYPFGYGTIGSRA